MTRADFEAPSDADTEVQHVEAEELEELISDPAVAATEYFKSPSDTWSLISFLETSKDLVREAIFFSGNFHSWHQRYTNRLEAKLGRCDGESDDETKRHLDQILNVSRSKREMYAAKAWFNSCKRTYNNMCRVEPFVDDSVQAIVKGDRRRMKTSRKRKAPLPPTPMTPGHEYWTDVFRKAKAQTLPHYRLSLPPAVRSRMRLRIAENAHRLLQSLVKRESGARAANRDFGILAEDVAQGISSYQLAFPSRVDTRLLHLLAQGRAMRNSPVHVRDRGNESIPWDSDYIFVTRAAPFCALASALCDTDDKWTSIDQDRVKSIRRDLHDVIIYAAITARDRVEGLQKFTDMQRELEHLVTSADELDAIGGCKAPFVAGILKRLKAAAVEELRAVLRYEFGLVPLGWDLPDLTKQLTKVPAAKVKENLRLYGGASTATLCRSVLFAAEEAERFAVSAEIVPAAITLYYVGAFVELLITLRMKTTDLREYLEDWEALVVAFAAQSDLDAIEAAKLASDETYRKRQKRVDLSSDDVAPAELSDPFVLENLREPDFGTFETKKSNDDAQVQTEDDPELFKRSGGQGDSRLVLGRNTKTTSRFHLKHPSGFCRARRHRSLRVV